MHHAPDGCLQKMDLGRAIAGAVANNMHTGFYLQQQTLQDVVVYKR
jgi:hypothetical protein